MQVKFILTGLITGIAAVVTAQQLKVKAAIITDSVFKGSYVKVLSFADKTDDHVFKDIKGKTVVVISEFLQMPAKGLYSGIAEMKAGQQVYLYKAQLQKVPGDPPPFISKTIEEWKTDEFLTGLAIPDYIKEKNRPATAPQQSDFLNSLSIENIPVKKDEQPAVNTVASTNKNITERAAATTPDATVTDWTKQTALYSDLCDSANKEANLGHYEASLVYCNAAIRLHPNLANGIFLRGRIYQHFGMYRLAVKDMELVAQQSAALRYQANQNISEWRPYADKQPLTNDERAAVQQIQTENNAANKIIKNSPNQLITVTCPKCGGSGKIEKFGRHTGYIKVVDYSSGKKLYNEFGVSEGFYTETCYRCSGSGSITKLVSQ
ncbi:DnaJ-like cysteine-rich domain-containing protein [Ferruginibacter sp.]